MGRIRTFRDRLEVLRHRAFRVYRAGLEVRRDRVPHRNNTLGIHHC